MKLLIPLGLLGLLSLLILLLIYIIKPNYQKKNVSSTYVWMLSLQYRKRRIPFNKLQNVLLILCQVLILVSASLIIAEPNRVLKEPQDHPEVIAILDSSASMYASTDYRTRFERAIDKIIADSKDIFRKEGMVSVIVADENPDGYLVVRARSEEVLSEALNGLYEREAPCSYGSSDIDGAIELCEELLIDNPDINIRIYTDTAYSYVPEGVTVVSVALDTEWNAGILDAYAQMEDNYFVFYVDVACYGVDTSVTLSLEVQDANIEMVESASGELLEESSAFDYQTTVNCAADETVTVIFKYFLSDNDLPESEGEGTVYYYIDSTEKVYSFRSAYLTIEAGMDGDSFAQDDSFEIYGGQKEIVNVQYASSSPNTFIYGMLYTLKNKYQDLWDIRIKEVRTHAPEKGPVDEEEAPVKGYDVYIFEHTMPEKLPADGIVIFIDPLTKLPGDSGFTVTAMQSYNGMIPLVAGDVEQDNVFLNGVNPDRIGVSLYEVVKIQDAGYTTLMYAGSSPALMVRDDEERKTVVINFSLHYSNIAILPDFPMFFYNIFEYFLPATVEKNAYEVNDRIALNARGKEIAVSDKTGAAVALYSDFPAAFRPDMPGVYFLTQETDFGDLIVEKIYVKIPAEESNVCATADTVAQPYRERDMSDYYKDLLLYFAIALVALMLAEWCLKNKDGQ